MLCVGAPLGLRAPLPMEVFPVPEKGRGGFGGLRGQQAPSTGPLLRPGEWLAQAPGVCRGRPCPPTSTQPHAHLLASLIGKTAGPLLVVGHETSLARPTACCITGPLVAEVFGGPHGSRGGQMPEAGLGAKPRHRPSGVLAVVLPLQGRGSVCI